MGEERTGPDWNGPDWRGGERNGKEGIDVNVNVKKWVVSIRGKKLLQNNPESGKLKGPEKETPPELLLYRDENGNICQPAIHIKKAIEHAAGTINRKYIPLIRAYLHIEPELILHKNQKWKPFGTWTVVKAAKNARVWKTRPMIENWELTFTVISLNPKELNGELIKAALERAGALYGIGDWRPQKGGSFGLFEVVEFREVN